MVVVLWAVSLDFLGLQVLCTVDSFDIQLSCHSVSLYILLSGNRCSGVHLLVCNVIFDMEN